MNRTHAILHVLSFLFALGLLLPVHATAQTLDLHDAVRSAVTLTNTTATLTGRSELRLTGTGDPLAGSEVHLNSTEAWLRLTRISPSSVAGALLGRVRVNGLPAVLDGNVRVVSHGEGTVVIPQGPAYPPLEVFNRRYFTGSSQRLSTYVAYDDNRLGRMAGAIGSFRLKRGYMATFAQQENGGGISRCYVAQDGDLDVGRLPSSLENNVHFVRVFPWRWVTKKGIAGNIESGLNVQWLYNWNLDRGSPLNWEYVPIRQTQWWPPLDQDWRARGATHLLGFNEPDRPDQADMSVGTAIGAWPDLLGTGLRVGAPAVSDGGLSWLYDFMAQADAAGLRVDFVPVHYYRCYGNVGDPNGTANQFYNFLKGIYDVVQRPLWVTEWNNGANWTGCADPSFAQQEAAIAAMIDMLDNTPFVERYALYNWVEDVRRVKWDDGSLTAAGVAYRDQASALAYRQEMANAGIGSSAVYSFDGNTHDGWGNGQDAMRVGAPSFITGRHGQAIRLNGSTDYLQISPRVGDSSDWSFSGWVYWDGGGAWQRLFDLGRDTSHSIYLTPRSSSDTLRFGIEIGGTQQQLNAPMLPVGVWTHVAVTLAGNTGKLFVNGQVVDTHPQMSHNPSGVGTRFNYLGRSQWPADPLFSGRFDEFRFHSSALTDAQVAAIANLPPPRFASVPLRKPDAAMLQAYTGTLAGEATGAGTLTFSKMDGPAWLAVGPDGSLSGTPSLPDGGQNQFLVRVTDVLGSIHTTMLHIQVPTLFTAIASGEDDAEQAADGTVNLTSSDLELVNDGAAGDQIIGLRFDGLAIPQGAVVTNAILQFTADESQSGITELNIAVEAADDAPPFTTAANNLGARALGTYRVPWQSAAWTEGQAGTPQRSPNLAGLVQEVVTRPGWTSGNALVFLISGTGHRTAESGNKSGGAPARLILNYTTPTPRLTLATTVTGGANDAEQSSAGAVNLTSSDLELVNDGAAGDQTIGLRFDNFDLPIDAVIAGAHLQFSADETQNEPTTLMIRAEAADHAALFSAVSNDLSTRTLTEAGGDWQPAPWTTAGERGPLQRTPDVSALVREVISRPNWTRGNAMAFLISGAGHRTAESADKAGGFPATLTVDYTPELPRATFAHWVAVQGVVPLPGTDLDEDGYDALFEYALGMNPHVVDLIATPVTAEDPWLYFTYTRPADVTDLTYQVQWSNTLDAPWMSLGVTQNIISDDGARRTILVVLPKGTSGQRFIRLKVTQSSTTGTAGGL